MYECTKNRSVTSAEPCPTPIALTAFRKCRRNVKARSTNLYFKEAKKESMEEGVILSEYWKYVSKLKYSHRQSSSKTNRAHAKKFEYDSRL